MFSRNIEKYIQYTEDEILFIFATTVNGLFKKFVR